MIFDWTVTLGNVLTILGFLVTGLVAILAMKQNIAILAIRMSTVEKTLSEISHAVLDLARQGERLTSVERRLEDNSRIRSEQLDAMNKRIDDISRRLGPVQL
ncbi:MAG TPA: hypothetical protein VKT73_15105 [Xanthobacteraceae bacterium]|nr:hypothetical protein [Xanthobacteraceae bacterium]